MSLITSKAASIVAIFANAEAGADKAAAQVKATWRKPEDARVALIPAFCANPRYKGADYNVSATTGLVTGWKSGKGGRGDKPTLAAKQALARLLRLAYQGKKANQTDNKTFDADKAAASWAKQHTPSQLRRYIVALKAQL
jgi:hypothetical protein